MESNPGASGHSRRRVTFLPSSATPAAAILLTSRALRAFGDGLVSLLLPVHLALLGFDALEIGLLVTATLFGSSLLTLSVGLLAHRFPSRTLLIWAAILMLATGISVTLAEGFWPLLLIAFLGTLNPSAGDVSLFLPLEQAHLTRMVADRERTALFARYSFVGSFAGAVGALAAASPEILSRDFGIELETALNASFVVYALIGGISLLLYRRLPIEDSASAAEYAPKPLQESRGVVLKLAALFSLDAFGGGFVVQSLLALWLFDRFGMSLTTAAAIFFWTGLLSAGSYFVAVRVAQRIGLINTMVLTHLPSSICLILVPLMPSLGLAIVLLLIRSALSQMDVPTRTSYVMAVVTPGERAAAAGMTAVPRSLAAAVSPSISGLLLSTSGFGWPLVIGGGLKIIYDLLLLRLFRKVLPPEERGTEG